MVVDASSGRHNAGLSDALPALGLRPDLERRSSQTVSTVERPGAEGRARRGLLLLVHFSLPCTRQVITEQEGLSSS